MLAPTTHYAAMLLGATGNVGAQILQLLARSARCNLRNIGDKEKKSEALAFDFLGL
jgi:aspartate-semialdehyde dehydrogenase